MDFSIKNLHIENSGPNLLSLWGFEPLTSCARAQRSTDCTKISHKKSYPKHCFEVKEKSIEKKNATENSVKCYSKKILRVKDAVEKAVKCYGKIRREKRFYRKTCKKTRKYPNQNCPSNYNKKKALLEEQIFPRNYQNFSI
jgi:hypothetical protein